MQQFKQKSNFTAFGIVFVNCSVALPLCLAIAFFTVSSYCFKITFLQPRYCRIVRVNWTLWPPFLTCTTLAFSSVLL